MKATMLLATTLLAFVPACSTTIPVCLQTPPSSKVPPNALQTCQAALEEDPDRQDVFNQFMALLRARGRHDDIVSWSRKILARDAARIDARYNLAYGLRKTGECREALKQYLAYAEANTQDPDPYYGMGLCYLDLGEQDGATRMFTAYVEKEQRSSQQEWLDKARAHLSAIGAGTAGPAASPPVAPAGAAPVAAGAAALPRPAGAGPATLAPAAPVPAPAAQPAVSAAPLPAPAAPANAAPAAAPASGDCSAAERAIAADPFAVAAYDQWGSCAERAGRHAEVVRRMRTALRDNPEWSRGYYYLGRALRATGDAAGGKAALAKACAAGVAEACGL